MRKNKKIAVFTLLMLLSLAFALSACSPSTQGNGSYESESEEIFEPAIDQGADSELYKRHEEYKENASLAFKSNSPLGKESFRYEVEDGQVKIVEYIGEDSIIVIPESIDGSPVTAVKKGAFSGGAVLAVYIPDSVKSIEEGAFENCGGLSTLRLPFVGDGGENAFLGCIFGAKEPDENSVAIPASLDMVIVGANCTSIADEAFRRAKSLSAVVFEGEIESVGSLAFYECADLVYITLERVTGDIGEYALAFASSLYFADISNAETVGKGIFYRCQKLNGICLTLAENDFLGRYFGSDSVEFNGEFIPASLRCVTVAEGTKKIPDRAFTDCKYITSVTLPRSLVSVGIRAFYLCRSLSEITIPDSVTEIEDDAFFMCDGIVSLKLGSSLKDIGMQAFYGCASLKGVECPESLEKIGASAFYGCASLSSVSLGGVKVLGRDAFGSCQRLTMPDLDGIEIEE